MRDGVREIGRVKSGREIGEDGLLGTCVLTGMLKGVKG
jgi:hypothetical protein